MKRNYWRRKKITNKRLCQISEIVGAREVSNYRETEIETRELLSLSEELIRMRNRLPFIRKLLKKVENREFMYEEIETELRIILGKVK